MLSAQTQTLDQGAVTVDVNALEVIKHTTTVADHQQQTTTGVVIVLVLLEVLGQISDALGEQSNLDLRGAGVTLVGCVGLDDFLLFLKSVVAPGVIVRPSGTPPGMAPRPAVQGLEKLHPAQIRKKDRLLNG